MDLKSRSTDLVEDVTDALAVYRLTKLIMDDKITEDLREKVWERYGQPADEDSHKISYLLTCPWCLSIYFATGAVLTRMIAPKAWRPISRGLALSALTGLLVEREG